VYTLLTKPSHDRSYHVSETFICWSKYDEPAMTNWGKSFGKVTTLKFYSERRQILLVVSKLIYRISSSLFAKTPMNPPTLHRLEGPEVPLANHEA
jgi:hypothetical protein